MFNVHEGIEIKKKSIYAKVGSFRKIIIKKKSKNNMV